MGGFLVGRIFSPQPGQARPLMVKTSGLIGLAIGAMVLWTFKRSERARHDDVEQAAQSVGAGIPGLAALPAAEERGRALGRRRVVPHVRGERSRRCRPHATGPGLYPGRPFISLVTVEGGRSVSSRCLAQSRENPRVA